MSENGKDLEDKDGPVSMSSLIVWNITKALEKNPTMDLKSAMQTAQNRLELDVNEMVQRYPEDRHLLCAMLAWQQLGHSDADSLHKFVQELQKETNDKKKTKESKATKTPKGPIKDDLKLCKSVDSPSFEYYSKGPVVKLPVETKIVMRLDTSPPKRKQQKPTQDASTKLDAACCMDTECIKKLANLDKMTSELRDRARKLARREAERVELLERAETAWRDLEAGYQRRIALAEEKEEDMSKQIAKMIEERNAYKNICSTLVADIKNKTELAEQDKSALQGADKEVCERACVKLRLSEECARAEAVLAEQQCKTAQLERDLQFKETQARNKMLNQENEVEVARALAIEAERMMRAELVALREQVSIVSGELLEKDEDTERTKDELEQLRQEKMDLIEDLDGCKVLCDGRMQEKVDELNKKIKRLAELKEEVMDCCCKLPIDVTIEVKRTPSLAALCTCNPEDKLLKSCSCTSLRDRMINSLLEDLFSGLQAELGCSGTIMPCQLLKCLEDSHNWDKASVVKTNLRNFFSNLLLGELDIAIATSIEKYHARWVGESCADAVKASKGEDDNWEERAIDSKAQKLASQMAEQLFEEKAEELAQRAKEIIKAEVPTCECKGEERIEQPAKRKGTTHALYPCLVKSGIPTPNQNIGNPPAYWRKTHQDVVQIKQQIEDLKKEAIKKGDLKEMEEKITKMVQQASDADYIIDNIPIKERLATKSEYITEVHTVEVCSNIQKKTVHAKKKPIDTNRKGTKNVLKQNSFTDKFTKPNKRFGAAYAVNVCLCGGQKGPSHSRARDTIFNEQSFNVWKQKISKNPSNMSALSSVRQTKPISTNYPSSAIDAQNSKQQFCKSDCNCLNKKPSTTSINKLLETLMKWKSDLIDKEEAERIISEHSKTFKMKLEEKENIESDYNSYNIANHHLGLKSQTHNKTGQDVNIVEKIDEKKLPPTTMSLYMGEINLDKSNEIICKCNKVDKKSHHNMSATNKSPNGVFKCINSEACHCKKSVEIDKENQDLPTSQYPSLKSNTDKTQPFDYVVEKQQSEPETRDREDAEIQNMKATDYHIKFLGVTLTDASTHKLKNDNMVYGVEHNLNTLIAKNKSGSHMEYKSGTYNKVNPKCYVESTDDNFGLTRNDIFKKENTANEESIQSTYETPEPCVCCINNTEDTKDLEVNTFHLLEEHLKEKLDEFRSISCNSCCIPSHEEEKVFSDIMKKVKQVISDCAKEIKCKCPGDNTSIDGSWNRAYGLLQEYLKLKIERVQCLCSSSKEENSNILGNILEKVYNLIEHDFDRLKSVCKCKRAKESEKRVYLDKVKQNVDVPEKDINDFRPAKFLVKNDLPIIASKNNSAKSLILTENISSQVQPGLGMEAKSCDAMSVKNKNVQTTPKELQPINILKFNDISKIDCDCYCNITESNGPFLELFGNKEVLVNLCSDSFKNNDTNSADVLANRNDKPLQVDKLEYELQKQDDKKDLQIECSQKAPYIGYTVDCSCDRTLGACVCMKSVVHVYDDKINSMWNTYIASKGNEKDLSYIMKSIHNKIITNPKNENVTISTYDCQSQSNLKGDEEFVLKYSTDKVSTAHNTTNTLEESFSLGTEYSNTEDPIDWFECTQLFGSEIKTSKDMLRHSILYPPQTDFIQGHKSKIQTDHTAHEMVHRNCDCNVVPICHVKMLVENIENNLINSKCTCDSMTSKVCPVHSKIS